MSETKAFHIGDVLSASSGRPGWDVWGNEAPNGIELSA